jgi:hypothetical protein
MSNAPFNIVVGVGRVYIAPVGETMPAVDLATPAGNWIDMGSTDDDGVKVTHARTLEAHFKGSSVLPQKSTISEARETIAFNLVEISAERYAKVLDNASVTTQAAVVGAAGYKSFPLAPSVSQFALLVRGPSPVADGYAQYEYERVSPTDDHELAYGKTDKTVVPCSFEAFESTGTPGQFGVYRAYTAAALPA